ncbi:hypothetical protein A1OS_03775 [Enterovibrio norvegicus]|uniref:L,D-transpeptidase family protein n=1 Tax=Enterovibrio norvegicus TaxID=188144 RepID=UPI0003015153|nr:L,D-transpeptidase family protein [Enterovibrio norvegicus]OEE59498.1 hypothetical protein A1OS_03775 [Enterovibrio norvegicus]
MKTFFGIAIAATMLWALPQTSTASANLLSAQTGILTASTSSKNTIAPFSDDQTDATALPSVSQASDTSSIDAVRRIISTSSSAARYSRSSIDEILGKSQRADTNTATTDNKQTVPEKPPEPIASTKVDLVKIDKSKRKMFLLKGEEVVASYGIALGANPKGHKLREGDKRTPEGRYTLDLINERSRFYRSIRINYPSKDDLARAELLGFPPGGQIMIHGQKNGNGPHPSLNRGKDWTDGCVAISNKEMDEFLALVNIGTPIEIEW